MAYYISLFSPATYTAFSRSKKDLSGYSEKCAKKAEKVKPGDRFVCYVTKVSRIAGLFEVLEGPFRDDSPLYVTEGKDPYPIRFRIRALAWFDDIEKAIPVNDEEVKNRVPILREKKWTGIIRQSLMQIPEEAARAIEREILKQKREGKTYPLEDKKRRDFLKHGGFLVNESGVASAKSGGRNKKREDSFRIQALLAKIGHAMGMKVWVPRNDRKGVERHLEEKVEFLKKLPLAYEEAVVKTCEEIDVLWIKGRGVSRAFEVEHTTSIYSGLLRLNDLKCLLENLNITSYIVAPTERKKDVLKELGRPSFEGIKGTCKYLSFTDVEKIASSPMLSSMKPDVLDKKAEASQ